jgi:hypothetical protein
VVAKNVLQVLAFFNTTRNAILQARQALQYILECPAALQLLLLLFIYILANSVKFSLAELLFSSVQGDLNEVDFYFEESILNTHGKMVV